jgi:hypothetical protein
MLKPVLHGQKCSTDTDVKQATIATLHKMSACIWVVGEVLQKNVEHVKGVNFQKETVLKPQESSDSE